MSLTWDLMPERCRAIFARRRARRMWMRAYVIGGTMALTATAAMQLRIRSLEIHRGQLAVRVEEHWNRNEEAKQLREEIKELEATITRYQRLAWPVRVTDAIGVIAPLVPDEATLTSFTVVPKQEKVEEDAPRAEGKLGKPARRRGPAPMRTILALEIEGIAKTDADVARFVQGVESTALFSAVGLDFSRSREVDGIEAREFRVTCQIDMSRRVVFVDPDSTEGVRP
jgi:Tfp pilus assembly protein PilN